MNRRELLTALAGLAAAQALPAAAHNGRPAGAPLQIGRYTFAGPGTVNTWWIETPRSVIVIDVQRDLQHAGQALKAVQATGKPVSAVLISHGHPDHYAGLGLFLTAYPQAQAYASSTTQATIRDDAYGFNGLLQQIWPDNFPRPVQAPQRLLQGDETLRIDGVEIATREFGKADANSMTVFYLPQTGDLFAGDLILSKMHLFFHESASSEWLAALDRLALVFPQARRLYPGHGERGLPRAQILQVRAYLEKARALAAAQISRQGLGEAAQAATVAALQRAFPQHGNPVGLPNMLQLSVAGLFKELAQPGLRAL